MLAILGTGVQIWGSECGRVSIKDLKSAFLSSYRELGLTRLRGQMTSLMGEVGSQERGGPTQPRAPLSPSLVRLTGQLGLHITFTLVLDANPGRAVVIPVLQAREPRPR